MTGRLPRVLALGLAVGLTAALSACSSASGGDAVTVTEQVQAPPAGDPSVTVPADDSTADPRSRPSASSKASDPASDSASDNESDGGGSAPSAPPTSRSSAATSSKATSKAGATRTSGSNADPGYVIPTKNDPDVSRDVPGPDGGRKCATDAKYYDEDPTGMRPDVIAAWHHLEKVANAQGIIVCLNDGKRSSAQQQAQYDEYVKEYGKDVADQLVLSPEKSSHVTGNAMDVQPAEAYQFLQSTKGSLGLCRIYDNEPWHFEYDVKYFTQGCPARLPKPEN